MTRTPAFLLALLLAACGPAPDPSASVAPATPEPTASKSAGEGMHGQLAFVAGHDPQIYLLDLATGESRQLTRLRLEHAELRAEGPMRPALTCEFGPGNLAWSPDGSHLAFSYGGCETVLYIVDLAGELTRVADGISPAWTPDGSRLVFAPNVPFCMGVADCGGEPPHPGAWSLQVFDIASGAEPKPLSVDPMTRSGGRPDFSPDGSLIAFTGPLPDREANPELFSATYVIGADGSNPRLVARGAWAADWLPDGRLLIVEEQSGDLHAIGLHTGEAEALGGDAGPGVVSPDGSRLLFTSSDPETGAPRVRMATLDGEALAELEGFPAAWAPDSSAAVIAVSIGQGAGLAFVGRDGQALGSYTLPDAANVFSSAAWRPESGG